MAFYCIQLESLFAIIQSRKNFSICRYSARGKRRDKETLEQGLNLQRDPSVAAQPPPLQCSNQRPQRLEQRTPMDSQLNYPLLDKGPQEDGWFFQATDARLTRANHLHFPNENSLSAITGSLNTFLFQALLEEETVVSDRREFQKTICSECPYHFCGNCGEAKSGGGHQQYFGYI